MPAGLQILNDALIIQIDQDYKNLALVAKATVTTDTLLWSTSPFSSYVTVALPAGVVSPIIATSGSAPALIMNQSDTSVSILCKGAVGTSVTYYVFGEPSLTPAPNGTGLEVLTAAGEVAYSSEGLYLSVLDEITTSASSLNGGAGTIGGSGTFTGRTVAVVQNSGSFAQHTNGGQGNQGAVPATGYGAAAYTTPGHMTIECIRVFGFMAGEGYHQDGPNGAWLLIDVTNY